MRNGNVLRMEKSENNGDQKQPIFGHSEVVGKKNRFLLNKVKTLEQAKNDINAALIKEKEGNKLKSHFISIASHEFRTPLTTIQLSASMIEHYFDRMDKIKLFKHLSHIKTAVHDLTDILNDFLCIEKIEMGKLTPDYQEFNLQLLVEEIIAEMVLLLKPGQEIKYTYKIEVPVIKLDEKLLRQCLRNLIVNAIKYSGEGGQIEVKTETNAQECNIWVIDNGIGIPKDDQDHIFETFFRASNTTDIQGTGLGLNIIKRYVDLMQGTISFESNVKTGTAFKISFPMHTPLLN